MPGKDYSGTPLPRKLGIKEGSRVAILDAPEEFVATLSPLPVGVEVITRTSGHLDVVVVFATRQAALERRLALMSDAGSAPAPSSSGCKGCSTTPSSSPATGFAIALAIMTFLLRRPRFPG